MSDGKSLKLFFTSIEPRRKVVELIFSGFSYQGPLTHDFKVVTTNARPPTAKFVLSYSCKMACVCIIAPCGPQNFFMLEGCWLRAIWIRIEKLLETEVLNNWLEALPTLRCYFYWKDSALLLTFVMYAMYPSSVCSSSYCINVISKYQT